MGWYNYRYFLVLMCCIVLSISCQRKNGFNANDIDSNLMDCMTSKSQKFVVNQIIDLRGCTIEVKCKAIEIVTGGMITNGTLVGNHTQFSASRLKCFDKVDFKGTWSVEEGFMEWFVGEEIDRPLENFKALCNLVTMDTRIVLNKIYPIENEKADKPFDSNNKIRIEGKSNKSCGLTLMKKSENIFFPYFRTQHGNSLDLYNITIQTSDYLNKFYSNQESDYIFSGSYYNAQYNPNCKPNLEEIKVENCVINGAISLAAYGSHSDNQTIGDFEIGNKVNKVLIKKNIFNFCNSPFAFSNMQYDSIFIENNNVKNISSTFIGIPASGINYSYYAILNKGRRYIHFKNNTFENDRVIITPSTRAMSPCVIKAGEGMLIFENNTLKNLINGAIDSDTYTFYFTCSNGGKVIARGNKFYNVLSRSSTELPACLIKDRATTDFTLEENIFEIDNKALVALGILSSEHQSLSSIDNKQFYFSFMQNGSVSNLLKKYVIKNNVFRMPYVNLSSEVSEVRDLLFENNTLEIGYYGISNLTNSATKDNIFFLGNKRLDLMDETPPSNYIFRNNRIKIGGSTDRRIDFLNFIDGVQNGAPGILDKRINFNQVTFDGTIEANDLNIGYTLLDGKSHKVNLTMVGVNNYFRLEDPTGVNHSRPNTAELNSNIKLGKINKVLKGESVFSMITKGHQMINIKAVEIDNLSLLSYNYLNTYYNLKDELPIKLTFNINAKDSKGVVFSERFILIIESQYRSFCHLNEKGSFEAYDPSEPNKLKRMVKGTTNKIRLQVVNGNKHLEEALIQLIGCKGLKDLVIDFKCEKINIEQSSLLKIEQELKYYENKK